jgi:hypothetical protein
MIDWNHVWKLTLLASRQGALRTATRRRRQQSGTIDRKPSGWTAMKGSSPGERPLELCRIEGIFIYGINGLNG